MFCEAASRIPPGNATKMYLCHPVGGKTRDRTTCKQNHVSRTTSVTCPLWISGFLMLGKTQNPQGTFWRQLWSIIHGSNCRFSASSLLAQIQPRSADFKETFCVQDSGPMKRAGLVQSKSTFFKVRKHWKSMKFLKSLLYHYIAVYSKYVPSYLTLPYLTLPYLRYGIFWFDFHFTSASLHFNLGSWRLVSCHNVWPRQGWKTRQAWKNVAEWLPMLYAKESAKAFLQLWGQEMWLQLFAAKTCQMISFGGSFTEDFHAFSSRKTLHLLMIPAILQPELTIFSVNHTCGPQISVAPWHARLDQGNTAAWSAAQVQLINTNKKSGAPSRSKLCVANKYDITLRKIQGPSWLGWS